MLHASFSCFFWGGGLHGLAMLGDNKRENWGVWDSCAEGLAVSSTKCSLCFPNLKPGGLILHNVLKFEVWQLRFVLWVRFQWREPSLNPIWAWYGAVLVCLCLCLCVWLPWNNVQLFFFPPLLLMPSVGYHGDAGKGKKSPFAWCWARMLPLSSVLAELIFCCVPYRL